MLDDAILFQRCHDKHVVGTRLLVFEGALQRFGTSLLALLSLVAKFDLHFLFEAGQKVDASVACLFG